MSDWVDCQRSALSGLVGERVVRWSGTEMAIRETSNGGMPVFEDPLAPCLQLLVLEAVLGDRTTRVFRTYQNDGVWGLCVHSAVSLDAAGTPGGIFRQRLLPELPSGGICAVSTRLGPATGGLAEVILDVDGTLLVLIAGEIEETRQGQLLFHYEDESVLAVVGADSAGSLPWSPPRGG